MLLDGRVLANVSEYPTRGCTRRLVLLVQPDAEWVEGGSPHATQWAFYRLTEIAVRACEDGDQREDGAGIADLYQSPGRPCTIGECIVGVLKDGDQLSLSRLNHGQPGV
jgi:hypothetical protein